MAIKEIEWRPTPKQALFLSIPLTVKEGFYAGAVAAGKTDVLLLYPIIHQWYKDPEFKGLFLRRTFPELKNEVIPRSRNLFRQVGGTYNKNDKVWEFNTGRNRSRSPQGAGALFFFGHCENEDDVHNYDSMQPNYAAFDELTSFTHWQYIYINLERVRRKLGTNLPAIVRAGSNPGNTGHTWVRKRFIDPYPEGEKIIRNSAGLKRIFIPATVYDNPHIDPEYLKSLESLPTAEKQAKLYGRWDAFEGSVFDEFRDRHIPGEPDNAIHVVDRFDIPEWWPKIVIGDWGMRAMTWIGHAAISPDRRVYLYREQTYKGIKIEQWAPFVKYHVVKENPRVIKFCKSAGQDRGQEQTIQEQLSNALDFPVELTRNSPGSRISTKSLLHEYLRWEPRPVISEANGTFDEERARWILRNRPPAEYESYLRSFNDDPIVEVIPRLQIFRDCNEEQEIPEVVNAIKACVYAKDQSEKPAEDVAEFDGDDPYDGIRYLVDAAEAFFEESSEEFKRVQREAQLIQQLNHTKDYTAYYRNMSRIESEDRILPVNRYH